MQLQLNTAFGDLIRQVHLKGLINEAAINFTDGEAHCQAVDITNTVFVDCKKLVSEKNGETYLLGLAPLSLITKYTAGADSNIKMDIKGDWVHLRKKGSGSVKLLSMLAELVPTRPAEEVNTKLFFNDDTVVEDINSQIVANFLEHQDMINSPSVVFTIAEKTGRVTINSNEQADQQFSVSFGKVDIPPKETIHIEVYSNFLVAIFKEIDFSEEAKLYITVDFPVVITQPGVLWALTPMMV